MPGHVGVSNLQVNLWGAIAHKAHGDGESKNPGPCFFFGGGGGGDTGPTDLPASYSHLHPLHTCISHSQN